jgi:hypothetical protein
VSDDWRRFRPGETAAKISARRARAGDPRYLAKRVAAREKLDDDEVAFIVAHLRGEMRRPRGPRADENRVADQGDAATFVYLRLRLSGGKVEHAVALAMELFGLPRSEVYAARRRLADEMAADPIKAGALEGMVEMARRLAKSGD